MAITALGDAAGTMVPTSSLAFYAAQKGWPGWLYAGSSLAGIDGPPPPQLTVADDLIIGANLFALLGPSTLVAHSIGLRQPAIGSVARLAVANAPTLGATFAFFQRLMALNGPYCRPFLMDKGEAVVVGMAATVPLGAMLDHLALWYIAHQYREIIDLPFVNIADATIDLTMPEGPESAAIRALFQCELRFGAELNHLSVPAAWLGLPNPAHDPMLWALAGERLRAAEAQFLDDDMVSRLRQRIAEMLTDRRQPPRLVQVAGAEGISTRSLVRHLAAAGHSFRGLVDAERRRRALQLMHDPANSNRAIAEQLGFPDVSSFGRTFRRWFGDSPARFRRNQP